MKDRTTFGLSLEKLSRLLRLSVEDPEPQGGKVCNHTSEALLREFLSRDLALDPGIPSSLSAVLKKPGDGLSSVAGKSVGDLLLNPGTDLAVLKTLKDYSKALPQRSGSDLWHAVATAIYYAAIASALVNQGRRITQLSYEKLLEGYEQLEEKPWIPRELKDLFEKARGVCQKRRTRGHE